MGENLRAVWDSQILFDSFEITFKYTCGEIGQEKVNNVPLRFQHKYVFTFHLVQERIKGGTWKYTKNQNDYTFMLTFFWQLSGYKNY